MGLGFMTIRDVAQRFFEDKPEYWVAIDEELREPHKRKIYLRDFLHYLLQYLRDVRLDDNIFEDMMKEGLKPLDVLAISEECRKRCVKRFEATKKWGLEQATRFIVCQPKEPVCGHAVRLVRLADDANRWVILCTSSAAGSYGGGYGMMMNPGLSITHLPQQSQSLNRLFSTNSSPSAIGHSSVVTSSLKHTLPSPGASSEALSMAEAQTRQSLDILLRLSKSGFVEAIEHVFNHQYTREEQGSIAALSAVFLTPFAPSGWLNETEGDGDADGDATTGDETGRGTKRHQIATGFSGGRIVGSVSTATIRVDNAMSTMGTPGGLARQQSGYMGNSMLSDVLGMSRPTSNNVFATSSHHAASQLHPHHSSLFHNPSGTAYNSSSFNNIPPSTSVGSYLVNPHALSSTGSSSNNGPSQAVGSNTQTSSSASSALQTALLHQSVSSSSGNSHNKSGGASTSGVLGGISTNSNSAAITSFINGMEYGNQSASSQSNPSGNSNTNSNNNITQHLNLHLHHSSLISQQPTTAEEDLIMSVNGGLSKNNFLSSSTAVAGSASNNGLTNLSTSATSGPSVTSTTGIGSLLASSASLLSILSSNNNQTQINSNTVNTNNSSNNSSTGNKHQIALRQDNEEDLSLDKLRLVPLNANNAYSFASAGVVSDFSSASMNNGDHDTTSLSNNNNINVSTSTNNNDLNIPAASNNMESIINEDGHDNMTSAKLCNNKNISIVNPINNSSSPVVSAQSEEDVDNNSNVDDDEDDEDGIDAIFGLAPTEVALVAANHQQLQLPQRSKDHQNQKHLHSTTAHLSNSSSSIVNISNNIVSMSSGVSGKSNGFDASNPSIKPATAATTSNSSTSRLPTLHRAIVSARAHQQRIVAVRMQQQQHASAAAAATAVIDDKPVCHSAGPSSSVVIGSAPVSSSNAVVVINNIISSCTSSQSGHNLEHKTVTNWGGLTKLIDQVETASDLKANSSTLSKFDPAQAVDELALNSPASAGGNDDNSSSLVSSLGNVPSRGAAAGALAAAAVLLKRTIRSGCKTEKDIVTNTTAQTSSLSMNKIDSEVKHFEGSGSLEDSIIEGASDRDDEMT